MNFMLPSAEVSLDIPEFPFREGDLVLLGDPRSSGPRGFVFKARHVAAARQPSRLQFINVETNETIFKTDAELAEMMATGHFDVLTTKAIHREFPRQMASALLLTDKQKALADKRERYAKIVLDLPEDVPNKRNYVEAEAKSLAMRRDERPLSYNTILKYADIYQTRHHLVGNVCLVALPNPGRAQRGYTDVARTDDATLLVRATQHGVSTAVSLPKGSGEDALHSARVYLENHGREDLKPKLRSVRTFQRRMAEMNRAVFEHIRFGAGYSRRKWAAYYERARPELPLEEVECDHTTLDLRVFDEDRAVVWGRPDIITFKDRATGIVLGYSVGFEAPSFASFMQGLRHAVYPKNLANAPAGLLHRWPYFGRPKRLLVDNALHFVGHDILGACQELGIEKVELRPGNPWLKGAQERLFGIMNGRIHQLPGATQSNVAERKKLVEREEDPAVTLRELDGFLTRWFVDEYNVSSHEGLGPLRSLKGNPSHLWRENLHRINLNFLPSPDLFLALIGDSDERTITQKGVEWDYIYYQSDALNALRSHPSHKQGTRNHRGTKYKVIRDPYDIGKITLRNPYDPNARPIEAQACRADYARGLTLHQHRVHLANWKAEELRKAEDAVDLLMKVKDDAQRMIEGLRKQRKKTDVPGLLARYLDGQSRKARATLRPVETESVSASAQPIDPSEPERLPASPQRSKEAMESNRPPGSAGQKEGTRRLTANSNGRTPVREDAAPVRLKEAAARQLDQRKPPASSLEANIAELRRRYQGFDD